MKVSAVINLYIDEFDANDKDHAQKIIDKYIDLLAQTRGDLTWVECDWEVVPQEETK